MRTYGGTEVYFHSFLMSSPAESEWSALPIPDLFSGVLLRISVDQEVGLSPKSVWTLGRRRLSPVGYRTTITGSFLSLYIKHSTIDTT